VPGLWKFKPVTFSLDVRNILEQRAVGINRQSSGSGQSTSATDSPGTPVAVAVGVKSTFEGL